MEFRMLGPFDVVVGDVSLGLGGPKPRAVLAALVDRPNQVLSTDTLVDVLWGDNPPRSADSALRSYLSRLRRVLSSQANHGDVHLASRPPGYQLTVDPQRIDARRFEDLVRRGRTEIAAGEARTGSATLRRALDLWRGNALADLTAIRRFRAIAARLDEMRLTAIEDRLDAELGLGRHAALIGELEELTTQHPFRERLWIQLTVALYRCGRQVDALAACRSIGATLREQYGITPGPELQRLEAAVLQQSDDLDWRPGTRDVRLDRRDAAPVTASPSPGEPHTAMALHVDAGRRALVAQSFQEALGRFRSATELIDTTPGVDPDVAHAAWLGLATAAGEATPSADHHGIGYLRAAAIAREHGWPQRLAVAAVGWFAYSALAQCPRPETGNVHDALAAEHLLDEAIARLADRAPRERCVLLAVKVVHAVMLDRVEEARALLPSVEDLATSCDDATTAASTLIARCWALLGSPQVRELHDCAERALALAVPTEVGALVRGYVLPILAVPALRLGDRAAFDAARSRVAAHPETRRSTHLQASLRMWDAALGLASGRLDDAAGLAATLPGTADWSVWDKVSALQRTLATALRGDHAVVRSRLAQVASSTPVVPMFHAALAYIATHQGRLTEARQHVEALRPRLRDDDLGLGASITLSCLGDVAAHLHAADVGEELLAILSGYSGQMMVSYTGATVDGAADRAIGQALIARGCLDEAIEHLAAAQELEQGFGSEALAIRSAYWQARARQERLRPGDTEVARRLLRWASSGARRFGMRRFEQECLAALP